METLLESLIGLGILVGLAGLARADQESSESAPALIPIPVKDGRRRR